MVIEEPKKKELEKKEFFVAFKREINEERNKQICRSSTIFVVEVEDLLMELENNKKNKSSNDSESEAYYGATSKIKEEPREIV